MMGHRLLVTHVTLPFSINQSAYRMKVVARNAGPSLWGRPVFVPRVN